MKRSDIFSNYTLYFETLAGSRLYGTATENSDIDYRGVVAQPFTSILGLRKFEQQEIEGEDSVFYGLNKFVSLALDCNPNIIELLFAPIDGETCIYVSDEWKVIRSYRHKFLSKKVEKTFFGYAYSQLERMQTHHRWMNKTEKPPEKPNPNDFGRVIIGEKETWTDYNSKVRYDQLLKEYQNYKRWIENRNAVRSELEKKYGYDTKHALHLIRLMDQGIELLEAGEITLPRPNAKFLLEIRNGLFTYEELLLYYEKRKEVFNVALENTTLPDKPSYNYVNDIVMRLNAKIVLDNLTRFER